MKKKLLEKDGFYLALFACVCLLAIGGVWFTKNNVDELASNKGFVNKADKDDELQLIEKDNENVVPTTNSEQNLEKAKEKAKENDSKLSFLGTKVIREYSEKEPSYSKTLDVWEIHKGLDISAKSGSEIKSLLNGKVESVFTDDQHGISVKVKSDNDTTVVYSNLSKDTKVKKGQEIKSGDVLGTVGNTSSVEGQDGSHVHVEAFKGKKYIDPMSLIK
ncbi:MULTISPECIES: M23 family metallopeptidase [Clostridia]|uniref:M23 family metallopeptidase n=1 Tax=Clostridium sp. CCUG 7971 TaxID=2811414 RepID=UPI001ABB777E|nr:M23 family metallopeptidase [Clostridium sp. CCUG 7971]MBO3446365.1 M23 family metallopeptidase [Clostridium sp. CCUG 7971]